MKQLSITLFITLAATTACIAQSALPGPKGVWILCGQTPSDNHQYQVSRKTDRSEWQVLATLSKPGSAAEIQSRMLDVLKQGLTVRDLSPKELEYAWRNVRYNNIDSLFFLSNNYAALYALGLAFYDATALQSTRYSYKITSVENGKVVREKILDGIQFPGRGPQIEFELLNKTVTRSGITLEYLFEGTPNLAGVNVYRGYYERTTPERINPGLLFARQGNKWKLTVSDKTVSPKVAYTYFIQPYDAAGNEGSLKGSASLYNVPKNSIAPSVNRIKTSSDELEKAIRLSWRLDNYADIVSIEIYRSKIYDGEYLRIASLPPTDTTFMDVHVKPIETYYYSVVLNGMYETSVQSARVAGMLKASEKNVLPVNNFSLSQQGNLVTLQWQKADPHTHSYFLYRAEGIDGELKHIKTIVSDSSDIQIVDTLASGIENKLYQYAVRSQNTSYKLGPFSVRANAVSYGTQRLPMPIKLEANRLSFNSTRLVWKNQSGVQNSGFMLYRKEVDENGKVLSGYKAIARLKVNQYIDSGLVAGKTYVYGVRNIGLNDQDLSNMSPEVKFEVIREAAPGVQNIQVSYADGVAHLRWHNPVGIDLKGIEIYKAEEGSRPAKLQQLSPTTEYYDDQTIQSDKTYYYFLKTVTNDGSDSGLVGPAGILAR
jgi:fibronectin type 3 domain-containing protein